jgi:hypothetical protein
VNRVPRPSDSRKAAVFSALVVVLALGTALVIRALNLPNGLRSSALYMCVPAATVLAVLMLTAPLVAVASRIWRARRGQLESGSR